MIQASPYGGYEDVNVSVDKRLAAADDGDIGYYVDVDLGYTDTNIKK